MAQKDFSVRNGLIVNGALIVATGGKVGINNASPVEVLSVGGTTNFQGNSIVGGILTVTANLTLNTAAAVLSVGNSTVSTVANSTTLTVNSAVIGYSFKLPEGNTGNRPASSNGNLRFNSELNQFEGFYSNGVWQAVGGIGATSFVRQQFVGDGTTTNFIVSGGYNVGDLDVYTNGVKERVGTDVDTSTGTLVIFTVAPASGALIDITGMRGAISFANAVARTGDTMTGALVVSNTITTNASLTVGTAVTNTSINSTSVTTGSLITSSISDLTGLTVGNSTVNTSVNSTSVTVANVFATTINSTSYLAGNSTVNSVSNSTYTFLSTATSNAYINAIGLFIGNSTVNSSLTATGLLLNGIAPPSVPDFLLMAQGIY